MNNFMNKDFLLSTETSKILYYEYASKLPIIDYHCHIDAEQILDNKPFSDISGIWLSGDHYKWRLMRACGVDESLITGDAPGYDKFKAFAKILPLCAGNPVYHWAHLELQRFFDYTEPICPETTDEIWKLTSDKLRDDKTLTPCGMLEHMNVEAIITTDFPSDSLDAHSKLSQSNRLNTKVLPGFRPDALMNIESDGFTSEILKLGEVCGKNITSYDDLKSALSQRIEYFNDTGCRASDHGILKLTFAPASEKDIDIIFKKALSGETVDWLEADRYRYDLLNYLAGEYARRDWIMELHLGVLRGVNTDMQNKTGSDTGFDSIGNSIDIKHLAKVLNALNTSGNLPKTVIFSANPNDNAAINTLAGCFCGKSIKGKVQQGSAWWFNDTYGGIREQLRCFSEYGVLGCFLGMLTDSRSFTSYVRHEYFRRILCDMLGNMAEHGLYTDDMRYPGKIAEDVCYYNVKEFFRL